MNSNESTSSNSSLDNCCLPHNCCNNTKVQQQELNKNNNAKKSNSLTLLAQNLRRGRSLNFTNKRVRSKCSRQINGGKEAAVASTSSSPSPSNSTINDSCGSSTKNKSPKWVMKFNCAKKERTCTTTEDNRDMKCCICTCYRRTEEHHLGAGVVFQQQEQPVDNIQYSEEAASGDNSIVKEEVIEVPNEKEPENNFEGRQAIIKIIRKEELSANNSDLYGNVGANSNIPFLELSW